MTSVQEPATTPAARSKPRGRNRLFLGSGLLLGACIVAADLHGLHLREASPYAALDAYTTAVGAGDRSALESIVDEGPQQKSLIERHATNPMTVRTVTMEMTSSLVWWSVQLRFEPLGQPPFSERLLVHPRSGPPDRPLDFVISPEP